MTDYIDPRSKPDPPPQDERAPAAHGQELAELVGLCRTGRVYEVERWIQEGRPIQALIYTRPKKPKVVSPLRAAVRSKHSDIVLLLLCNGYRLDLESDDWRSVLDEALEAGTLDILELLLKWGADPRKVRPDNVLDTYSTELIGRFWDAGVDYTVDRGFVPYLAQTVNKPLYGWLRRNRSDQRLRDALDLALHEAVTRDRELPVRLLLWAGADPHRKVPYGTEIVDAQDWHGEGLSSSAETAIFYGRRQLFGPLRVGELPNLESLAAHARDCSTLREVVALHPPSDWSPIIVSFIRRMCLRYGSGSTWDSKDALRIAVTMGGRLATIDPVELRHLRSGLLEVPQSDDFRWLVKWLKRERYCEPAIYRELTRTPAMRKRLETLETGARFVSPSQKMSRANARRRRTRQRPGHGEPGQDSKH